MDRYAFEAYGLAEEQLVCMVYSPFVDNGAVLAKSAESEGGGPPGAASSDSCRSVSP